MLSPWRTFFASFFILQSLLLITQTPWLAQVRKTEFPQGNGISTFGNIIWGEALDPNWGNVEWISPNSAWRLLLSQNPARAGCGMWLPQGLTATGRSPAPELHTWKIVGGLTLELPAIKRVWEWGKGKQGSTSTGNTHWKLEALECWARTELPKAWAWQAPTTGGSRARTKVTVDAKLIVKIYSPFQAVEMGKKGPGLWNQGTKTSAPRFSYAGRVPT